MVNQFILGFDLDDSEDNALCLGKKGEVRLIKCLFSDLGNSDNAKHILKILSPFGQSMTEDFSARWRKGTEN